MTINDFGELSLEMRSDSRPTCILGLGLIGGSLLRDLSGAGRAAYGWDRSPATVKSSTKEGFDTSLELEGVLARAEADDALVVIATPMPAVGRLLDAIGEHAPGCGITDVISVKQEVLREVQAREMEDVYVGGHPMSGTSSSGWDASQVGLFDGAPWVVTFDNVPGESGADRLGLQHLNERGGLSSRTHLDERGGLTASESSASGGTTDESDESDERRRRERWLDIWTRVVRMAMDVNAEVVPARAHTHDAAVARVSHLPHVLAEILAVVGDQGGALALSLAAGSFKDGTRVAGTAPGLVQAMCENNVEALLEAIGEAQGLLEEARAQLECPEQSVEELAGAGYRSRVRFEVRNGKRPVIRLHPGAPGWVAQLAHAENLGGRIEIF